MNKEFVPYEEALTLKELGFDEPCFAFYQKEYVEITPIMVDDDSQYRLIGYRTCINSEIPSHYISAPLYQQAFRWFREKNYDVAFRKMDYGNDSVFTGYYYTIYKGMEMIDLHGADKRSKTYEEAELACLRKLIEIVKNKKQISKEQVKT